MKILRGAADIFDFFRHNETPLYYFSTTTSNIMGANEWIQNLTFINSIDSFDSQFPYILVFPPPLGLSLPGIEVSNNYLLGQPAVADQIRRTGAGGVLFLMFNDQTEALAHKLGMKVAFPPAKLREHLDNKMTT